MKTATELRRQSDASTADLIRHRCCTGDRVEDKQLAKEEIIRLLVQIGYDQTVDAWLAAGAMPPDDDSP